MSAISAATVAHPSRTRSRLLNRAFTLPGVDGNSAEGRYYRDLCLEYAAELGDPTKLSEGEKTLIRTTAGLALEASRLQARIVKGEEISHEQLVRVNNALTRNLATMRRKAKAAPTAPSLASLLPRRSP